MTEPRARFLLVSFTWRGTPKLDELKPLFSTALDWVRYASHSWILWTTNGPDTWLKHIKPHLGENDLVLICELDLSNSPETYIGWNAQLLWDWIRKHQ
jgi:hypothetical protein